MRAGWIGVDLFFVLSGFLITGILIKARGNEHYFRNFYMRRTLRIFPAYYLYLLLVFGVLLHLDGSLRDSGLGAWALPYFFYVQNLANVALADIAPWPGVLHLWSLAVEEQFYWLWPLLVYLAPPQHLKRACVAVIALAWGFKLAYVLANAWPPGVNLHTLARMDALAIGAWIAADQAGSERQLRPMLATIVAVAGFAVFAWVWSLSPGLKAQPAWMGAMTTTAIALALGAVMYRLTDLPQGHRVREAFAMRPLMFFGKYSYGIYVIHILFQQYMLRPAYYALEPTLGNGAATWLSRGLTLAAVVLGAVAMFHLVEQPALRLKRHFSMGPSH